MIRSFWAILALVVLSLPGISKAVQAEGSGLYRALPPGLEAYFLDFVEPALRRRLVAGSRAIFWERTRIEPTQVSYFFKGPNCEFQIRLGPVQAPWPEARRSAHFSIQALDSEGCLADHPQFFEDFVRNVMSREGSQAPWMWVGDRGSPSSAVYKGLAKVPTRDPRSNGSTPTAADWITSLLQWMILAGFGLLALRWRSLWAALASIGRWDWFWLSACSACLLILATLGGPKVPAWINSHGYELLRDVLQVPPTSPDPHGQAWLALHGLLLFVFPRSESTILSIQLLCAVLCLPLIYALARAIFSSPEVGRISAAVLACSPSFAWFAFSEVRLIPGLTFALLGLCVLVLAMRDGRLVSWLAAALLGFVATQFYPVLMLLPVVALGLLGLRKRWQGAVLGWKFWLAGAVFSSLWLLPACWMLHLLAHGQGIVGSDFLLVLAQAYRVVMPDFSDFEQFSGNIWLNHRFTPPWLTFATGIGILAAVWRPKWRAPIALSTVAALLLTIPGLIPGGMNPARLQLAAQAFYAILAAVGLVFILNLLNFQGWRSKACIAVATLGLGLLLWPGPLGRLHTPQFERRFFEAGLARLSEPALLLWPPHISGGINPMPTYLFADRDLRGATLFAESKKDLDALMEMERALYYFHPSSCHLQRPEAYDCRELESRLQLEPIELRYLPARADYMRSYRAENGYIPVGFYRIRGLRLRDP